MPPYSEMKVPFLLDQYQKTPLHYLLIHTQTKDNFELNNKMFKFILDYLDDNIITSPYNWKLTIDSVSNLYPFILSELSPALALRFTNMLYQETVVPIDVALPEFGSNSSQSFQMSPSHVMEPEIQKRIHKEGQKTVTFQTIMLQRNYNVASGDMLDLVLILNSLQDEEIFKTPAISNLITYLWRPSKVYHLLTGLFYSVLMSLLTAYFIIGKTHLAMEIIILLIACLFLGIEIMQIVLLQMQYFKTFWNYVDLMIFPLIMAKIITIFTSGGGELSDSWVFVVIFLVGYVRWVSFLQIFEPTRKLIIPVK